MGCFCSLRSVIGSHAKAQFGEETHYKEGRRWLQLRSEWRQQQRQANGKPTASQRQPATAAVHATRSGGAGRVAAGRTGAMLSAPQCQVVSPNFELA